MTGTLKIVFLFDVVDAAAEMGAVPGYRPELLIFLKY
jgi:hypothetical protein